MQPLLHPQSHLDIVFFSPSVTGKFSLWPNIWISLFIWKIEWDHKYNLIKSQVQNARIWGEGEVLAGWFPQEPSGLDLALWLPQECGHTQASRGSEKSQRRHNGSLHLMIWAEFPLHINTNPHGVARSPSWGGFAHALHPPTLFTSAWWLCTKCARESYF